MARKKGATNVPLAERKGIYAAVILSVRPIAVARYYSRPKSTVSTIMKRYGAVGGAFESGAARRGRPRKLNEVDLKRLERVFRSNEGIHAIKMSAGTRLLRSRTHCQCPTFVNL